MWLNREKTNCHLTALFLIKWWIFIWIAHAKQIIALRFMFFRLELLPAKAKTWPVFPAEPKTNPIRWIENGGAAVDYWGFIRLGCQLPRAQLRNPSASEVELKVEPDWAAITWCLLPPGTPDCHHWEPPWYTHIHCLKAEKASPGRYCCNHFHIMGRAV